MAKKKQKKLTKQEKNDLVNDCVKRVKDGIDNERLFAIIASEDKDGCISTVVHFLGFNKIERIGLSNMLNSRVMEHAEADDRMQELNEKLANFAKKLKQK